MILALLLAASWTDPGGKTRCEVPDAYASLPNQPWRFARADGLRQLVFLTVKPVAIGARARAKQLLERTGASGVTEAAGTDAVAGRLKQSPQLSAAMAVAPVEATWAGVLVLGPPAANVAAEASALASACRAYVPAIVQGRVFDETHRFSAAVPPGHQGIEVGSGGAVHADGYTLRLLAVQKRTKDLQEHAKDLLAPTGAKLQGISGASAGPNDLSVVIASGTLVRGGVDYLVELALIDLGNGEVAGILLDANASATSRARDAMDDMLRTVSFP